MHGVVGEPGERLSNTTHLARPERQRQEMGAVVEIAVRSEGRVKVRRYDA
jgi:hypothetical protein